MYVFAVSRRTISCSEILRSYYKFLKSEEQQIDCYQFINTDASRRPLSQASHPNVMLHITKWKSSIKSIENINIYKNEHFPYASHKNLFSFFLPRPGERLQHLAQASRERRAEGLDRALVVVRGGHVGGPAAGGRGDAIEAGDDPA